MRQGLIGAAIALLLVAGIGVITVARTYALYYDCSQDQDTSLVVMNSYGAETYYTVKIYDAYGSLLEAISGDLVGFESDYHILSGLIDWGETTWGLVLVETPKILTIGVETFVNGAWSSSDNIVDAVPEDIDYTYYWYGLNYSNTPDQTTGIVIVNPNDFPAAATLFIHDSFGVQQEAIDVVLDPHETDYYNSTTILDVAIHMWGVVDVKATVPIVIAAEYFGVDGVLLNVDQIAHFYYCE